MTRDRRPHADSPALFDSVARLCWLDSGSACLGWLARPDDVPLNEIESCIAAGYGFASAIEAGGFLHWLLRGAGGGQAFAATGPALESMGAVGMAGHVRRTLDACLGPDGRWRNMDAGQWRRHIPQRLDELAALRHIAANRLVIRVPLKHLGLSRTEWDAFFFSRVQELAETGESPRYQRWFARQDGGRPGLARWARRLAALIAGDKMATPQRVDVCLDAECGKIHKCYSFLDPFHAGDMGYHYWECEFLAHAYDYVLKNIGKIRPAFRPME